MTTADEAIETLTGWASAGLLDPTWADLTKEYIRRPSDDTYDPDARAGASILRMEAARRQDRDDLVTLLEMAYSTSVDDTPEESQSHWANVEAIAERIGWTP